jgi:hypothetical protein
MPWGQGDRPRHAWRLFSGGVEPYRCGLVGGVDSASLTALPIRSSSSLRLNTCLKRSELVLLFCSALSIADHHEARTVDG